MNILKGIASIMPTEEQRNLSYGIFLSLLTAASIQFLFAALGIWASVVALIVALVGIFCSVVRWS